MKNRIFIAVFCFLVACMLWCSLNPLTAATWTRHLIGTQDINWATGDTGSAETFSYVDDQNKTLTLNKLDATYLKFRSNLGGPFAVEDLVDGGYDVTVKSADIITKLPWVDARAYGTAGSRAAINAAVTAIGSDHRTLYIAPGTWTIDDDVTIPSNVVLRVEKGATLSISTLMTLTINGPIEAGPYQIFSWTGSGAVSFGTNLDKAYSEWWGATGDGSTDDYNAVSAAGTASAGKCPLEFLTNRTYIIGTRWEIPSSLHLCGNGTLKANATISGSTQQGLLYGDQKDNVILENITIDSNPDNISHTKLRPLRKSLENSGYYKQKLV